MHHFGLILLLCCFWLPISSLEFNNGPPPNDDGNIWLNTVYKNHKKSSVDLTPVQRDPSFNDYNRFRSVPQDSRRCAEGAERPVGPIVFTCSNGREHMSHCLTTDTLGNKIKIRIGSTAPVKDFVLRCSQDSPNMMRLEPIACIQDGQIHQPGARVRDRSNPAFFHVCQRIPSVDGRGGGIQFRSGGCVDDNGQFVTGGYFNWQGRRMTCLIEPDGMISAQSV